jgi:hypothetical protein
MHLREIPRPSFVLIEPGQPQLIGVMDLYPSGEVRLLRGPRIMSHGDVAQFLPPRGEGLTRLGLTFEEGRVTYVGPSSASRYLPTEADIPRIREVLRRLNLEPAPGGGIVGELERAKGQIFGEPARWDLATGRRLYPPERPQ